MSPESELSLKAEALMAAGKYGDVIAMRRTLKPKENAAHADLLSRAYVMKGNALVDKALPRGEAATGPLLKQAGEKYAAALKIKPDDHEALVQGTTHPRLRPFFMAAIIRPMPSANYG